MTDKEKTEYRKRRKKGLRGQGDTPSPVVRVLAAGKGNTLNLGIREMKKQERRNHRKESIIQAAKREIWDNFKTQSEKLRKQMERRLKADVKKKTKAKAGKAS